jgi:uncharacterized membrane protein YedE/YeeE
LLTALLGGLLIGASASLAWSGAGQIAGISGIVGGFLRAPFGSSFRRWFLIGLLLTSLVWGVLGGAPSAAMSVAPRPLAWLVVAGLLRKDEASTSTEAGAARIDAKLVTGAAVFGAGWGMSGYCPGPALVSLGLGRQEALYFVVAMLAGMAVHRAFAQRREPGLIPAR